MQTKKNNWKALVLLLPAFICLSGISTVHPFYISVCDIQVKTNEKRVELSCKIFIDDLQEALHQEYKKAIQLNPVNAANQQLLNQYLVQHVKIYAGAKAVVLQGIGYEMEEEAVWIYAEGKLPQDSKQYSVSNSILCNTLEGQTNIVHFTYNQSKKSARVICPDKQFEFSFD